MSMPVSMGASTMTTRIEMAISPDFYKSVNMNMTHRIAMLENEVNLRDAYIGLLHQKIKESVDIGWHPEVHAGWLATNDDGAGSQRIRVL